MSPLSDFEDTGTAGHHVGNGLSELPYIQSHQISYFSSADSAFANL